MGIHNWLVTSIHNKKLKYLSRIYLKGRLLDVGCGEKPYEELLRPFIKEHIGVDHLLGIHDRLRVDLDATAYDIPLPSNSFDSVLCTAVLEHLEEPEQALREAYRLLKPGGTALYSVPHIWHVHEEPRDFYRFTCYGLEYLFKKVGYEICEINALSGFWVTFGQLFVYNIYRLNRGPLRWFRVIDAFGFVIQLIVYLLDKLDKTEQWTWMYVVVARKPCNTRAKIS